MNLYKAAKRLHGENCKHSDECSKGFHCKENSCSCNHGHQWDEHKEECGLFYLFKTFLTLKFFLFSSTGSFK